MKLPKTAIVIPADSNAVARVETKEWTLEELQAVVEGYIEPVYVREVLTDAGKKAVNVDLYVNEEGKLNGLPVNNRATDFAALAIGGWVNDIIVGNVVILGVPDDEGETTSVSRQAINVVKNFGWLK